MIRMTVVYRAAPSAQFDFDYYRGTHLEMSKPLLAEFGLLGIDTQRVDSRLDGSPADIVCMTHIDFPDEESLRAALKKHGPTLKADFANYTNIQPDTYLCSLPGSDSEWTASVETGEA